MTGVKSAAGGAARQAAAGLPRLLPPTAGDPEELTAHLARHGRPRYHGTALIQAVTAAGLTGRGGAAFPTHVKLTAAKAAGHPVVVANGAESEPASEKDAALLYHAPHLVLDGLALAAEAIGAGRAHLYLPAGHAGRIQKALTERRNLGLDPVAISVTEAPARFLAGQETALVSRISGGPALPTFASRRVTERGILVQNVETLAHLALISRHGPDWFRERGTPDEPGTMLLTLQAGGRPRVTEQPIGVPLRSALDGPDALAVLVGGYHGTWLPAAAVPALTLDNAALRRHGASLGAGVLAVLPPGRCGLVETARVTRYLAAESAGQCGPCLNGLPRIAGALAELAGPRPRRSTLHDVERWANLVTGRGACHHPDGTARFVRSALTVFGAELKRHASGECTGQDRAPVLPLPPGYAAPTSDEDWR